MTSPARERTHNVRRHLIALEADHVRRFPDYKPPEPPLDDPNQDPPDPWRGAFLTHLPTSGTADQLAALYRQREARGECNGLFTYGDAKTPLGPSKLHAALVASGAPCLLEHSPKNVTDQAAAAAWCESLGPAWWPYTRVAVWQEPVGDIAVDEWAARVIALADVCDDYGIASMAHMETWSLSDKNPNHEADTETTIAMLDAVADRLTAVTWSYFNFALQDRSILVRSMAAFMTRYKGLAYGITAAGVSVPYGIPADDPRRTQRVELLHTVYDELAGTDATMAGHYGLPQGPDPTRDFYDDRVSTLLVSERKAFAGR